MPPRQEDTKVHKAGKTRILTLVFLRALEPLWQENYFSGWGKIKKSIHFLNLRTNEIKNIRNLWRI